MKYQKSVGWIIIRQLTNHHLAPSSYIFVIPKYFRHHSLLLSHHKTIVNSVSENAKEKTYTDKVTDFTGTDIAQLKKDYKQAMNEIAEKMSEEEKQAFIEESNNVFTMNNLIVNSVGGQNKVLYNLLYKFSTAVAIISGVVLAYKLYK